MPAMLLPQQCFRGIWRCVWDFRSHRVTQPGTAWHSLAQPRSTPGRTSRIIRIGRMLLSFPRESRHKGSGSGSSSLQGTTFTTDFYRFSSGGSSWNGAT